MVTREDVESQLREVFDPEIPVNVLDLGLVYDIAIEGEVCKIEMTLTSQACPEAKTIPDMIKRRVNTLEGIESTEIEVVWEPQWSPHLISAAGKQILGMDDEE
ncbi:MAG TPA: iron-sulfur cluster assembly protein [Planctomycetota bacterium]|jgi:metal-sulfur cluster biosynthetic enzyme|nr:iron-sulfur cluster assembly protein [Planctomycetota bacterium]